MVHIGLQFNPILKYLFSALWPKGSVFLDMAVPPMGAITAAPLALGAAAVRSSVCIILMNVTSAVRPMTN